jgi:RimJ/RimL family protein N-acetyltransferase
MTTDRQPRESGDPASFAAAEEQRDSRFRGNDDLGKSMTGDGCRAELFEARHRAALKAACAEDRDVWAIYANNFGPDGFDDSIDRYTSNPNNRTFVLFAKNPQGDDELAGMSSYLGIDPNRQVLEIGGTYNRPKFRGAGFNRRVKDMMLRRAFECGIRRVEFRVDIRNARSQAAMKKLGAVREGLIRADRITWTGHVRDTVLFAILKDEWPI